MVSQSVKGTFLAPFAGLESHLPGLALCIAASFYRVGHRVPVDRPPAAENSAIGGGDASPKLIFDDRRTANRFGMDQLYYVPSAGRDRIACRLNGGVSRQQQEPPEATAPMRLRSRIPFLRGGDVNSKELCTTPAVPCVHPMAARPCIPGRALTGFNPSMCELTRKSIVPSPIAPLSRGLHRDRTVPIPLLDSPTRVVRPPVRPLF